MEYLSGPAGETPARRWARCRFGPGGDLAAVATDRGEVPAARVFLLKRYYLDTAEGIAADPGPVGAAAEVPEIPPWLAVPLQHLLAGSAGIAVLGLLASAYALVFGLVGRIHLALGEIAAVGAAVAGLVVAAGTAGGGAVGALLPLALAAAMAASALHDAVAGRAAFLPIPPSRGQASLIATVGLSLALSEYLRLAGAATPSWVPPLGADPVPLARAGSFLVTATAATASTGAAGLGAAALLCLFLSRSGFGRLWRAWADEPLAAALCGVDGRRLALATLALAGALAGLAGALVALRFGALGFAGGFGLGLKALAGAILGGIGSVPGALAGGLAVGMFETLWSAYLPIEGRDLALHAALIGAVVLWPEGVFGRRAARGP